MEADPRAPPVLHPADGLQAALRVAAGKALAVESLVARDLDLQKVRQGVHHRDADAVQAAAGLVDLRIELPARMQRRHDDFERGFAGKLRMRVDRDAAAVIGDDERAGRLQLDLDEAGMARHRLVHRVVDHLGEEVVQRPLVGAADIHAGPAPHRLQPLQHLDVRGGVAGLLTDEGIERRHRRRQLAAPLGGRQRVGGRALGTQSEHIARGVAHAACSWRRRSSRMGFHPLTISEQNRNIKGDRGAIPPRDIACVRGSGQTFARDRHRSVGEARLKSHHAELWCGTVRTIMHYNAEASLS